jgi:hypothetical protein
MVLRLTDLTPNGRLKLDETDALALALAGLNQMTRPLVAAMPRV